MLHAGRGGAEMHVHPESEHLTLISGRGTPRSSIRPPEMPTVEISMLEGRTADQKRQMAKSVTTAISTSLTVPEESGHNHHSRDVERELRKSRQVDVRHTSRG